MNARKIVTAILLLFVVVSVVVFITRETNRGGSATDSAPGVADASAQAEVVAYYFHGTARCKTCLTIEEYTKEALESGFTADLAAGRLAFEIINVDEPTNEHFVKDFELDSRSVVLARNSDGQEEQFANWRQLNRVWELVGDKDAFITYVRTETQAMLAGS